MTTIITAVTSLDNDLLAWRSIEVARDFLITEVNHESEESDHPEVMAEVVTALAMATTVDEVNAALQLLQKTGEDGFLVLPWCVEETELL